MKYLILTLACIFCLGAFGQDALKSCCTVVGIHPGTNSITARNNETGQLFMFRTDPADLKTIKMNDAVTTNASFTYVTAINGNTKQYFAGPVNLTQTKTSDALGIVSLEYAAPCCSVINIENAESCCSLITAQNKTSGKTFLFSVPIEVGKTIKTKDAVYLDEIDSDEIIIIQSPYMATGNSMNAFLYPVEKNSKNVKVLSGDKWTMAEAGDLKEFGRLNTSFPAGVQWGIDVFSNPAHKILLNKSGKGTTKDYQLTPGNYDFRLNMVMVENVPIEMGKETRLKAGYLNITTEGMWSVSHDIHGKVYSSGTSSKIALPVGVYKVNLNGKALSVTIKDGETVSL